MCPVMGKSCAAAMHASLYRAGITGTGCSECRDKGARRAGRTHDGSHRRRCPGHTRRSFGDAVFSFTKRLDIVADETGELSQTLALLG